MMKRTTLFRASALTGVVFLLMALPAMGDCLPVFLPPTIVSNQIHITLTGPATDLPYTIYASTNISGPWTQVAVGYSTVVWSEPVTNQTRFYRGALNDTNTYSLSGNVQPIFTASCATTACHTGALPAAGLNLSSGKAYAQLVNVASSQCSDGRKRVLPGQPCRSYLVNKIQGVDLCAGVQMPIGSSLTVAQQQAIVDWIYEGAPDN